MRRSAVPLGFLGAFTLIVPTIWVAVTPPPSPVALPAQVESVLAPVVTLRPAAQAARALTEAPKSAPAALAAAPKTYVVQAGDNLWSIAHQHDITVEALASANRLNQTAILRPGQALEIPPPQPPSASSPAPAPPAKVAAQPMPSRGATVVHVVRPGQTLWEIAKDYGTTVEDLTALNDLGDSDWIKPGQRLLISGSTLPRHRQIAQRTQSRSGPAELVMADASLLRVGGAFLWPSRGVITSRFGWRYRRHHNGVDLAAPRGTAIYAARDGVVDFAGWNGGYGRVAYIDHGGGLITVYGHASKLLVQAGQQVKRGQLIAEVGCTGACTGSHLHFEVRINGRAVNPLQYLQ